MDARGGITPEEEEILVLGGAMHVPLIGWDYIERSTRDRLGWDQFAAEFAVSLEYEDEFLVARVTVPGSSLTGRDACHAYCNVGVTDAVGRR